MAVVKVRVASQWFTFAQPDTVQTTIDNVRAVMAQREKRQQKDAELVEKLIAAKADLERKLEDEKARKAARRKAEQPAA